MRFNDDMWRLNCELVRVQDQLRDYPGSFTDPGYRALLAEYNKLCQKKIDTFKKRIEILSARMEGVQA